MPFFTDPPLHDFPDRAIRLLQEYPAHLADLVTDLAPHLAPLFDFDRTILLNRTFPLPDWRRREADLLFHVPFRQPEPTPAALVCVLLEHQSIPDPPMPLRTMQYAVLYWEREWRSWENRHQRGEPLLLTPVYPIVLYTGSEPWIAGRTMADLVKCPEEMRPFLPTWQPLIWPLFDRTPESLLNSGKDWLAALAAVRVEKEEPERFWEVFTEVMRRLEPLSERDKLRWQDLMWFLASWARRRRPSQEHTRYYAATLKSFRYVSLREEFNTMAQTIGITWEQEVFARGELRATRADLRAFLEERFGQLPEVLVQRIENTDDLERLKSGIRQGAKINALDQLVL